MPEKENKLNVRKAFEAIAEILGTREGVKITVKSVEEKVVPEEKTG